MQTASMIKKYKTITEKLLNVNDIRFEVMLKIEKKGAPAWGVIGEELTPATKDKEAWVRDWSDGRYQVMNGNRLVASWELYRMPHCCGIVVSCRAFVAEEFRHKGLGTVLNNLRQEIGRGLGYSLMMCTDIETNSPQRKLLKTNGWRDLTSFVNARTKNRVLVSCVNL
jgi:hypothetical protein